QYAPAAPSCQYLGPQPGWPWRALEAVLAASAPQDGNVRHRANGSGVSSRGRRCAGAVLTPRRRPNSLLGGRWAPSLLTPLASRPPRSAHGLPSRAAEPHTSTSRCFPFAVFWPRTAPRRTAPPTSQRSHG